MGHSVARVWQLNSSGTTMEQKVKKSLNYCRVLFAFLESRYIFLELLSLMAREGERKKLIFPAYLKQTQQAQPKLTFLLVCKG